MLPFLCPSLARSSLFIHADLLAFLPDFICNEMELAWEWRWSLNQKQLSWPQLSSEALSHRTPLSPLRRTKFALLMLRVVSPPHCPRILNSTISCCWNPAATDRSVTHRVYSSSWVQWCTRTSEALQHTEFQKIWGICSKLCHVDPSFLTSKCWRWLGPRSILRILLSLSVTSVKVGQWRGKMQKFSTSVFEQ